MISLCFEQTTQQLEIINCTNRKKITQLRTKKKNTKEPEIKGLPAMDMTVDLLEIGATIRYVVSIDTILSVHVRTLTYANFPIFFC